MSAFMGSQTVTARTEHWCDQCSRRITKGERYLRAKSVDYDGWSTGRSCAQCEECASDLWDADAREEDDYGNECYAYLPDVDWPDVRLWSPLWALRADRYAQQWAGQPYPVEARR